MCRILGLVVHHKNYLEVYPYDKWTGNQVPVFAEGEVFQPSVCELREGTTTSPKYLTEADLVTLMDKNGIGRSAVFPRYSLLIFGNRYRCHDRTTHRNGDKSRVRAGGV